MEHDGSRPLADVDRHGTQDEPAIVGRRRTEIAELDSVLVAGEQAAQAGGDLRGAR
jgi:hypothetical protein